MKDENSTARTGESSLQDLPELRYAEVSSGRIAYREAGSGPAVVFFHGMNGQSGSWLHQLTGLADRCRVISWDAPGYGGSDPIEGDLSQFAGAGVEFLDALNARGAIVVGHSMGGVIAGRMAIEQPDALGGLVLSCTHWGWGLDKGEPLMPRFTKRIEELSSMTIEDFAALRASRMVSEDTDRGIVDFLAEMSKAITTTALRTVGQANQEANNLPGLASLQIPAYILYAENDRVIKMDRTRTLMETMPNAKKILLKGVGHAPYIEDPSGYNRLILQIVDELNDAAGL